MCGSGIMASCPTAVLCPQYQKITFRTLQIHFRELLHILRILRAILIRKLREVVRLNLIILYEAAQSRVVGQIFHQLLAHVFLVSSVHSHFHGIFFAGLTCKICDVD